MSARVCMCAMSMETSVCVCGLCMIHGVTTAHRNDWTSWTETTAVEAAFSCNTQPNTLTESHLTGPSYRKWKRKPLVHPVLHPNLSSTLHVKLLLQTIWDFNCCKTPRERTGWGWKRLAIGGQMSRQLTFSHRRLAPIINVNAEFTDWSMGVVWIKWIFAQLIPIWLFSILSLVFSSDSQSGALQQDTQCLDSGTGPNQHCPRRWLWYHRWRWWVVFDHRLRWPGVSLVAQGLWLCSLVTVNAAGQPAFLCLSPHNGEYLQHSSVCVRCLRRSEALANPSTRPRGWHHR